MRASALKNRTRQLTVRIVELTQTLADTPQATAIVKPLLRCGTAIGARYRSVCRSQDSYDFMTRLIACQESVDQACYWLEILGDTKIVEMDQIRPLLEEGQAIQKILTRSRKTATKRYRQEAGDLNQADDPTQDSSNQPPPFPPPL